MNGGWIKLHRALADHHRFSDPSWVSVWIYLLINATHKPRKTTFGGRVITLNPGQIVTGRKAISEATGVHQSKVYRVLATLESENQIEQQKSSTSSLITITNWSEYQDGEQQVNNERTTVLQNSEKTLRESEQQMNNATPHGRAVCGEVEFESEQQMNNERTTNEQRVNTIQEGKEGKKERNKTLSASNDAVEAGDFYLTKKKRKISGKRLETFNRFWAEFSLPKGKAEAADAWMDIPMLTKSLVETICIAAKREASERPKLIAVGKTPKWAQGWITGKRWEDEDPNTQPKGPAHGHIGEPIDWREKLLNVLDTQYAHLPAERLAQYRSETDWRKLPTSIADDIKKIK